MPTWSTLPDFFATLTLWDYLVICVNLALIIAARGLMTKITPVDCDRLLNLRIAIMRGVNLSILAAYGYYWMVSHGIANSVMGKAISIVMIAYFAYLTSDILSYVINRSYGKARTVNGRRIHAETYQTRALTLLARVIIGSIGLVACIQQLGFNSLLEAGGVIGVLGVMVGLTQGAWAPDIISGLILLNSDVFEEGDVIELEHRQVGLIYKIKMFHTEIINLNNNHRIMIRNARLRDITLHNLSKFASSKGLRECLTFNIGYEVKPERVKRLFAEVTSTAVSEGVGFEHKHDTEWRLLDAGDHALQWGFIFYVKQVEALVSVRRDMRLIVLKVATAHGISLATPLTHSAVRPPQTHLQAAPDEATPAAIL